MKWKTEIAAAYERIVPYIRRTPALQISLLNLPDPVWFKLEHLQHTGTFKARGAFNTLLSTAVPAAGLVAASGGNHGAAVAFASHRLGHKAHIFVPELAGAAKINLIKATGANLTIVPGTYADALAAALAYETETGAMQIHAYDAMPTVAGQGSTMLEWEAQGLRADTVLIAVGGGGLIAGAMAWLQGRRKVVSVEPETSCALKAGLAAGCPVDVEISGIAANALGARRIGQICFDLAQDQTIEALTVSDQAIVAAQRLLWQNLRQFVEPAGATALAALICGAYLPAKGERVGILICGANPAPDPFL